MRVALLFPGQGAQTPGFLAALPPHPLVRETLSEAQTVLGQAPQTLDSAAALTLTTAVQLSLLIAGVATARVLEAEGVAADAVAGLSVGAFSAAVACGTLAFEDALRLVRLRGETMQRAAPYGHGMLALLGMDERATLQLLARMPGRPVFLASINSPGETILSGERSALEEAAAAAAHRGASSRLLQVSIPSHCLLMSEVAQQLDAALAALPLQPARIPYVTNHRARATQDAAEIAIDLAINVARPVRWYDSLTLLYELGCRVYLEAPPGNVLTRLVSAGWPAARALSLAGTPPDGVLKLLQADLSAS
jgi:malonate decarboxylase epsilon subunit